MRRAALVGLVVVSATTGFARAPWRSRVIYHVTTIDRFAATHHTHVRVEGRVTLVKAEADGDVHVRLDDGAGRMVVAEIVPYWPLARPRVGQRIAAEGVRRFDDENGHGWWELHPLERWEAR